MSNLNETQLDDIENEDNQVDDLIVSPSQNDPNQESVEIVAKTSKVPQDSTDLSQGEMQELLDMDVSFKVITDDSTKVVNLKDVEADFIAEESISRSTAISLDSKFDGLLDNVHKLNSYTQYPSKVNYKTTLQYVQGKIATEEAQVITIFDQFIDDPINQAKTVLSKVESTVLPYIKDCLYMARDVARDALEHASQSKDFVFPYKEGFVDIGKIDLLGLDIEDEKVGNTWDKFFISLLKNTNEVFKCQVYKSFFFTTINEKYVMDAFKDETIMEYRNCPVTLIDIFKFLSTISLEDKLDYFMKDVSESIKDMEVLQKESIEYRDNFTNIQNFIIENSQRVFHLSRDMYQLCLAIHGTRHLVLNGKQLAEFACKV